uniref:Cytochrome c oxidase subunit 5B, mitochondrial n=1 Tax=Plectus sambesii TaxID=2011161 RepID=A0A914UQT3_9BILA
MPPSVNYPFCIEYILQQKQPDMSQMAARSLCLQLVKLPKVTPGMVSQRTFASEVNREDYGYYPDPLEAATGSEKKMMLARLAGDDRYEPKIFYRGENTSKDNPNLIPSHYRDRLIACTCEPDAHYLNLMWIRKGTPSRCECGHWFKVIDADPDSY